MRTREISPRLSQGPAFALAMGDSARPMIPRFCPSDIQKVGSPRKDEALYVSAKAQNGHYGL